ncbi:MAG TPA: GNAT family N-acetyltransferase [Candidatus Sulfotelmatobacter sp.]|nr:GNAT family N-acetyltransferase [Candidatus Sulfotelmatobacter sp.]
MTRLSTSGPGSTATGVRLLRAADLAAAVELSTIAGWNQTADDWSMLMELAPEGCFGIEADGALVATTTLLCYGKRLAWIGMVLTKPNYRGRGFARALVTHALEAADAMGVKTVKLDATDQGQPLYQRLGFVAEGTIERWSRAASAKPLIVTGEFHSTQILESDFAAFGVDRTAVLEELAKRSQVFTGTNAYLFARSGRTTAYLGPCVAKDPGSAHALIKRTVASSSNGWSWDLLPQNPNAVALASELGFTRQRVLTRMRRGESLGVRDDMVYAIAGFELG